MNFYDVTGKLSDSKKIILEDFFNFIKENNLKSDYGFHVIITPCEDLGSVSLSSFKKCETFSYSESTFECYINPFISDLLFEFVLYHELGHFLKRRYKEVLDFTFESNFFKELLNNNIKNCKILKNLNLISDIKLFNFFIYIIQSKNKTKNKEHFFEFFSKEIKQKHKKILYNHLEEYECDLFSYNILLKKYKAVDLNELFNNQFFKNGKLSHPNNYNRAKFLLHRTVPLFRFNIKDTLFSIFLDYLSRTSSLLFNYYPASYAKTYYKKDYKELDYNNL